MTGDRDAQFGQWAGNLGNVWHSFAATAAEMTVAREKELAALSLNYQADVHAIWARFHAAIEREFTRHHDLAGNVMDQVPNPDLAHTGLVPPGPGGNASGDLSALRHQALGAMPEPPSRPGPPWADQPQPPAAPAGNGQGGDDPAA